MARFTYGGRATVVGTTLRSMGSLYAVAGSGFRLVEVGVYNTTTTALAVALVRLTNATGVGAGLTEGEYAENLAPPLCTLFAGHTADSAVGQVLRQATLGAAAGAGVIWTFGDGGIICTLGTANGIGLTCPTGTGQICDFEYTWEE